MAKHEWSLVLRRQALDLRRQRCLQIVPGLFRNGWIVWNESRLSVAGLPPGRVTPGAEGSAVSDAVQPARQRILLADGRRLAGEDDERGLECILGVLVMARHAEADIPDQPLMAAQEHCKRVMVVLDGVEV